MKPAPARVLPNVSLDNPINPLILDLLDWLAREPRSYAEVMDAWRTSCPRLPIWEDAVDQGFVVRRRDPDTGRTVVVVTAAGRRALEKARGIDACTLP
jgi:DNA-binding PadR family transcriptional regulator